MKTSKFLPLLAVMALVFTVDLKAQDATTWSTYKNGEIVPDTVALGDYLPLKDNVVMMEAVIELPNVSKQELFSRAKLAIQRTFTNNKLSTSNYDLESGICSINNFYDITDMTASSRIFDGPLDQYLFNAMLMLVVKDGKYKLKMEVPEYVYGDASRYNTYADYHIVARPVSDLANRKQANKRQRMRVLKTLNDKMTRTFNILLTEMDKKLDTDF